MWWEHQWHTRLSPRVPLFCSCRILTSSVIYCWTDAWQHGIYLLNSYCRGVPLGDWEEQRPWEWGWVEEANLLIQPHHDSSIYTVFGPTIIVILTPWVPDHLCTLCHPIFTENGCLVKTSNAISFFTNKLYTSFTQRFFWKVISVSSMWLIISLRWHNLISIWRHSNGKSAVSQKKTLWISGAN